MPVSSVGLLKRALDSGARPRAVVIDFHHELLAASPRLNGDLLYRVLGVRDALCLVWRARDPLLAPQMAIGGLLPSLPHRIEIGQAIKTRFCGTPDIKARDALRENSLWALEQGGQPTPENPAFADPDPTGAVDAGRWSWRCRQDQVSYIHEFIRLAESRGIRVFWVIFPWSPAAQANHERVGHEGAYTRFAASIQKDHPDLTIVDGRSLQLDRSYFFDTKHLSARGAEVLSRRLGEVIAQVLRGNDAATRWVKLDPVPSQNQGAAITERGAQSPRVVR